MENLSSPKKNHHLHTLVFFQTCLSFFRSTKQKKKTQAEERNTGLEKHKGVWMIICIIHFHTQMHFSCVIHVFVYMYFYTSVFLSGRRLYQPQRNRRKVHLWSEISGRELQAETHWTRYNTPVFAQYMSLDLVMVNAGVWSLCHCDPSGSLQEQLNASRWRCKNCSNQAVSVN